MRGGYYGDREYDMYLESGGIADPLAFHRPKGNAMPRTKQQELAATNKEIAGLLAKRDRLAADIARANRRPAPPADQSMWVIDVYFQEGGKRYSFLITRVSDGRFFTTGTGDTSVFASWRHLLEWLDENTVWHTPMFPLRADYDTKPALAGADRTVGDYDRQMHGKG